MSNEDKTTITITMKGVNPPIVWEDTDEVSYTWGVGQAGDLMIFRSKYHAAFAAQLTKDERIQCYAPGSWESVAIEEQPKVETSKGKTLQ